MNSKRLLERFFRYVSCPSESGKERPFCELIEGELSALGFTVRRDQAAGEKCGSDGRNVYASLPGEGEPILFSAHMDTVAPGVGIKPVVRDGVVYSSGDTVLGADNKAAIAAVLEAVETILEQKLPHRPIEVLFSICEELGLLGAKHADYSYIKSKQAVVLDTVEIGSLVNNTPANVHLHIEITGKSSHAGVAPDKGVHALKAAAAAIANIPCGFTADGSTVMNVANLLAPGKTNVVPDKATFDMEIRCFDEKILADHIKNTESAVKTACDAVGASYTITSDRHSDVLYVPESSPLCSRLKEVYTGLGVNVVVERTYGGCDATWLSYNGIDAINAGLGMRDIHSLNEHIAVADLELSAKAMIQMMQ